jgi:hypothetical protein
VLAAHFVSRVVGLIILPFLVYLLSFAIHFAVLTNTGPGDAQMSSLFQANLRGTEVGRDSPLEVAYGSMATIKNMGYGGGLLHSHVQTYPDGSGQQQVTCYHHKDSNNNWFFYPNRHDAPYDAEADPRFIADGETIRLLHAQTGRNLHSHQIAAPVTKSQWEVSCYGNATIGDDKDHWKIEVVSDAASRDRSKIRTLTTGFRLKHATMGCYLRAGNVNLPQWGFKQIEVTCTKENNPRDSYTHWNIESHVNEKRKMPVCKWFQVQDANQRQCLLETPASTSRPSSRTLSTLYVVHILHKLTQAMLTAPERRHDDLQQRPRPRPGQAGRPRLAVVAVAPPPRRPAHVRLGRQDRQVLFARQPPRLLGLDRWPRRVRAARRVVHAALAARLPRAVAVRH